MAVGLALVLYGMAPLLDVLGLMRGQPGEGSAAAADDMMAKLRSRVWADGAGFVLLVVGAVVEAAGRTPMRETIDDRIRLALDGRAQGRDRADPGKRGPSAPPRQGRP